MAKKYYTIEELDALAVTTVKALKPKGLTIGALRYVFEKAIKLLDSIHYGEPPQEDDSKEAT